MTLTAAPAPVEVKAVVSTPVLRRSVSTVATGSVLLWWGTALVRGGGGRDSNVLAVGLLLLAVAVVATRPWRILPLSALAVPGLLSVAALLVLDVGAVGRSGAVAAGAYVLAGSLVVVVAAWTSSAERAVAITAAVCLAGLGEFVWAFPAWWAGGTATPGPMVGTFFWWNPYAIYLLAPAIFGLALAVGGRRPWRAIGWLTTPFAVSGVALSTSRASLACLAAAWVIIGFGLLWQAPRRPAACLRLAVITAVSIGMPYVLTSGLVFRIGGSPLGATQARGAGDSVATNGSYRLDFWREAFTAFLHRPMTGTGYGRLLVETKPGTFPSSPLAHNGFLQALGEGGLLLGVPTALAVLLAIWLLLGSLRHPSTWSGVPAVAGVAGLGLLVHALVDFDWTFSADVAALAVCVALAAAPRWHALGSAPARSLSRPALGLALVLSGLTLVSGVLAIGQHFEIIHSDARPQPGATS